MKAKSNRDKKTIEPGRPVIINGGDCSRDSMEVTAQYDAYTEYGLGGTIESIRFYQYGNLSDDGSTVEDADGCFAVKMPELIEKFTALGFEIKWVGAALKGKDAELRHSDLSEMAEDEDDEEEVIAGGMIPTADAQLDDGDEDDPSEEDLNEGGWFKSSEASRGDTINDPDSTQIDVADSPASSPDPSPVADPPSDTSW